MEMLLDISDNAITAVAIVDGEEGNVAAASTWKKLARAEDPVSVFLLVTRALSLPI